MKYFYPRPPRGGRREGFFLFVGDLWGFLSTPSARRATPARCAQPRDARFLSTPSARRATGCAQTRNLRGHHFYPRPPRGGRPTITLCKQSVRPISIHALREEGDLLRGRSIRGTCAFLSTPSARRATWQHWANSRYITVFLSTPSARRATCSHSRRHGTKKFLSTPSARRATGIFSGCSSSHAIFLSTPSARRATCRLLTSPELFVISIHALREEGDSSLLFGSIDK